jgi:hypothetical protein
MTRDVSPFMAWLGRKGVKPGVTLRSVTRQVGFGSKGDIRATSTVRSLDALRRTFLGAFSMSALARGSVSHRNSTDC